ncbi:MAG TPA: hypothetical protein VMG12_16105, partial [Polyangiaceae bacterium]|nr:hypothetical protein [Polyangiaceae bacterium]
MMLARRVACVLGVASLALAIPRSAFAAELAIAMPSACPIDDDLAFRAERALGQSLESAADVRCTVHISRDGASYAARLEVQPIGSSEPPRQRALLAPSCEKLSETLALAISLAIASGAEKPAPAQREAVSSAPPSPAPSSAVTAELATPGPDEPRADEPEAGADARESSRLRIGASAALVVDAGSLPGVGAGAALGASLGLDPLELRVLGTYLPPREVSVASATGTAGAEIELLAGSLLACLPRVVRASEHVRVGACAGAELGWLEGTGTGVDVARS